MSAGTEVVRYKDSSGSSPSSRGSEPVSYNSLPTKDDRDGINSDFVIKSAASKPDLLDAWSRAWSQLPKTHTQDDMNYSLASGINLYERIFKDEGRWGDVDTTYIDDQLTQDTRETVDNLFGNTMKYAEDIRKWDASTGGWLRDAARDRITQTFGVRPTSGQRTLRTEGNKRKRNRSRPGPGRAPTTPDATLLPTEYQTSMPKSRKQSSHTLLPTEKSTKNATDLTIDPRQQQLSTGVGSPGASSTLLPTRSTENDSFQSAAAQKAKFKNKNRKKQGTGVETQGTGPDDSLTGPNTARSTATTKQPRAAKRKGRSNNSRPSQSSKRTTQGTENASTAVTKYDPSTAGTEVMSKNQRKKKEKNNRRKQNKGRGPDNTRSLPPTGTSNGSEPGTELSLRETTPSSVKKVKPNGLTRAQQNRKTKKENKAKQTATNKTDTQSAPKKPGGKSNRQKKAEYMERKNARQAAASTKTKQGSEPDTDPGTQLALRDTAQSLAPTMQNKPWQTDQTSALIPYDPVTVSPDLIQERIKRILAVGSGMMGGGSPDVYGMFHNFEPTIRQNTLKKEALTMETDGMVESIVSMSGQTAGGQRTDMIYSLKVGPDIMRELPGLGFTNMGGKTDGRTSRPVNTQGWAEPTIEPYTVEEVD